MRTVVARGMTPLVATGGFMTLGNVEGRTSRGISNVVAPSDRVLSDTYSYVLGRLLVIRQEQMDLAEPGVHYNELKYNPLGSSDFVNPNLDVAYVEAWIAVDDETPVLLEVPEINGRYYTAQVLDEWGEVIVNINERTLPSRPHGKFAFVRAGTAPPLPANVARIDLHSNKAKLLARVELKDDVAGALALQHRFKLTALGEPRIARPPAIVPFGNEELLGVEAFDDLDAIFASALDVSPVAAALQEQARAVARYLALHPAELEAFDTKLRRKIVPQIIDYSRTGAALYRNHWMGASASMGNYGKDYRLRTAVNLQGIWANSSDEVVYFMCGHGDDGRPLNGNRRYELRFEADNLPSSVVDGYWSVILVSVPDFRVVPNSQRRFNLNSYSPLALGPDGSLRILIAPAPEPGFLESNWLPSPAGRSFSLTFRCYVPKDLVKYGQWFPPALSALH